MLTLQQQASLFTLFGVLLVAGMGFVTYRQRPDPIYRSWVHSYYWAIPTTLASVMVAFSGIAWIPLTLMTAFGTLSTWWMLRMSAQLRERRFKVELVSTLLVATGVAGQALYFSGIPIKAAIAPAALCLVVAHLRLGWTMFRVGKREPWRGLDWLGVVLIAHGLWICTYPAVVDTPWHWVGHLIDACLEIGVGAGMVTFIMVRTLRELAELDRLKHDFLNAASHELRSPLTSVTGYAEFLQDEIAGPLNPEQAEYVGQIRNGAQRLRRIVDEMLDIARVQAGTFEMAPSRAELGAIVREEALALLPQAHERGVALTVELPQEELMAMVDARRVGQVVQNLVANALKFTPPGGSVRTIVRREVDHLRVEVADTGIGIDPTHISRLFEKYYQVDTGTRRAQGGAGLGLTIAKALVEAHGGQIGVCSQVKAGSTFWFTLPGEVRPELSTAPAPARGTGVGSPPSGGAG